LSVGAIESPSTRMTDSLLAGVAVNAFSHRPSKPK